MRGAVLLVVGMHRSGTSATNGALRCLGLPLGKKLYAAHPGVNPKGYFEHGEIVAAHDEALYALGSCWDDILLREDGWWENPVLASHARKIAALIRREFTGESLWSLKDPRLCRLLPWWLNILSRERIRPHFLFVLRSPEAVYQSLNRRDGFSREKSTLLWLLHYLEAERASREFPRVFIEFDRLVEAPVDEFERAERELEITFATDPRMAEPCLREFLCAGLRHHGDEAEETQSGPVVQLAGHLYGLLQRMAREGDKSVDESLLDEAWQKLVAIQGGYPMVMAEHLASLGQRHGQAQLLWGRVSRSWSWCVGKPIRFLERLFGRSV